MRAPASRRYRARMVVGYLIFKDKVYNGEIFIAQSPDGGKTFTAPNPLTGTAASQRFLTLALGPEDRVLAAWIDKRDVAAARRAGRPFLGASIAFAWSDDGGDTSNHPQSFMIKSASVAAWRSPCAGRTRSFVP